MDIEYYLRNIHTQYPSLKIMHDETGYSLQGEFILNHVFNGIHMTGNFELYILIPDNYPIGLPTVKELSNCIDKTYPHIYANGQFCLATDIDLKLYLSQNADICLFIENYIVPYLYTYKYYENYGLYPFGERSHGISGDLEYLQELFNVELIPVLNIISFLAKSKYRGHLMCPCGSNKRIRNCHGDIFQKLINAGLQSEFKNILLEVKKEYEKYNNTIRKA